MTGLLQVCAKTEKISKLKPRPESCPFAPIYTQSTLDHIHFRGKTNKNKKPYHRRSRSHAAINHTCAHVPPFAQKSIHRQSPRRQKPPFAYCFCVLWQEAVVACVSEKKTTADTQTHATMFQWKSNSEKFFKCFQHISMKHRPSWNHLDLKQMH